MFSRATKIQLELYNFPEHKPLDSEDGKTFLLCFGGWQWAIARWGAERQQFFTEGGDYIQDNSFSWAML